MMLCPTKTSEHGSSKKKDVIPPEPPDLLDRFHSPKVCDISATGPDPPDMFAVFRPKPKTVLDYNISQTDLKIQRQIKFGVQKVHVQETRAEYVVPPPGYVWAPDPEPEPVPQPPKILYSTAGKPCWDFAEDKWRRQQEKRQIIYQQKLKEHIAWRKRIDRQRTSDAHARAIAIVGPEWFQELSPNQLDAVDNLKSAIVRDVRNKTIENTQDVIAVLGLVLRPNPRHIKIALKKCCECPVEFLLLLYQLMNQHRTKYSINDRLLLSGVVHLTMRETLKELHIRIPSPPPPPPKVPKKPKRIEKPPLPTSPYLQQFTFKPPPPKHTGIYKNNHMQYPESPYFAYREELVFEYYEEPVKKKKKKDQKQEVLPEPEASIVAELKTAQKLYNNLVTHRPVPRLHKPSVYIPCDHGIKKEVEPPAVVEEPVQEEIISTDENTNTTISVAVSVKVTTDYKHKKPVKQSYEVDLTITDPTSKEQNTEKIIARSADDTDETTVEISETVLKDIEDIETPNTEEEVVNVVEEEISVEQVTYNKFDTDLVELGVRDSNECQCKQEVEHKVETRLCQCDRCKEDRAAKNISIEPQCDCLAKYQEHVKVYEELKKRFDVQQNLMTLKQKYILGGVTTSPTGEPIYMISGVEPKVECSCALVYQRYLEEQQRLENMPTIPLGKQKYLISGVRPTGDGNVFVVSGAVPTEDCDCLKLFKQFQNRHAYCVEMYEKYLKKMQTDNQEYLEELEPSKECCEDAEITSKQTPEASNSFEENKKIEDSSGSFVKTSYQDVQVSNQAIMASSSVGGVKNISVSADFSQNTQPEAASNQKLNNTAALTFGTENAYGDGASFCICNAPSPPLPWSAYAYVPPEDQPQDECTCSVLRNITPCCTCCETERICICEPEPQPKYKPNLPICTCGLDLQPCICNEDASSSDESDEESPLKRFIILEKFPTKFKEQMEILKQALDILAEDGFPLAKLPDCHRLPHFKLWLKLRSGKFWTMDDRDKILLRSKGMWRHTDTCTQTPRIQKLTAHGQFTWANAKAVRKMVGVVDTAFYRRTRQQSIDSGREFYPTTFSYEFPTPNFRDCYFAYNSAREADVTCWKPWYPHEVKGARG